MSWEVDRHDQGVVGSDSEWLGDSLSHAIRSWRRCPYAYFFKSLFSLEPKGEGFVCASVQTLPSPQIPTHDHTLIPNSNDHKLTDASEPGSLAAELSYREERKARPLYASPALHAQVLALVLRLLVSPAGRMDRGASDPFPCERGLPNAPHVLRHHLAHPGNAGVLADLAARCAGMGPATLRLLRLVSGAGFRPAWYARRARMSGAAGAYATVHRCALPAFLADSPGAPPRRVVLKVLDAARGVQDRCSSVDVHAEVGVMQALTDSRRAARLHDYGFDPGEEAYVLVLQEYACSLRYLEGGGGSFHSDILGERGGLLKHALPKGGWQGPIFDRGLRKYGGGAGEDGAIWVWASGGGGTL